jgi:hypothetical protein
MKKDPTKRHTTMPVLKSTGSTPSERLLTQLCDQTFLGFWSYANTFRDQGGGKEISDLIVVYGNHIILFSDKSCAFPATGNLPLDWSRWFRSTILDSAKQIRGAERWLKQHPDRVFLDQNCTQRLPISLAHVSQCQFHRIIVALGAQQRCQVDRGGSGSLTLAAEISGAAHYDLRQGNVQPFCVGQVDSLPGHLHVLDDCTLPLILKEADTVADFVAYLEFKEHLLASGKVSRIAGEEDLLAMFLSHFVQIGGWRELLSRARDGAVFEIQAGGWDLVRQSAWYRQAQEFLQPSYVWDRIIQEFATHAFGGTLYGDSPQSVAANEQIFRCMAGEPRIPRAYLAAKMLERWTESERDRVNYRLVASPTFADTLYAFIFVPNAFDSTQKYREVRQDYLHQYSFLVHCRNRQFRRVIGIATDAADEPYRTFEVLLLEGDQWTPEMERLAKECERDLRVSSRGTIHRITDPHPSNPVPHPKAPSRGARPRQEGRVGRNDPCPCQSGKKFKHCCLPKLRG